MNRRFVAKFDQVQTKHQNISVVFGKTLSLSEISYRRSKANGCGASVEMTPIGESGSAGTKSCPRAAAYCTELGSNRGLRGERPVTDRLSHGTARNVRTRGRNDGTKTNGQTHTKEC